AEAAGDEEFARPHRREIFQRDHPSRVDAAQTKALPLKIGGDRRGGDKYLTAPAAWPEERQPRQPIDHPMEDVGDLNIVRDRHQDAIDMSRLCQTVANPP